jgi:ribonucleoside-diphosphate reductase alpha chain
LREHEWAAAGEWMWDNKKYYNGLSVLPYDGGTYKQAPFQDCTQEEYERLFSYLKDIDLTNIIELEDETDLSGELACSGGACEIV